MSDQILLIYLCCSLIWIDYGSSVLIICSTETVNSIILTIIALVLFDTIDHQVVLFVESAMDKYADYRNIL